ncbi:hypothetical protein D9V37_09925 [Nocardioides mangrovicus]|uniref:DMT family transporter n=1 Tax=Nocardioides mangrovicus TaxID=2478913 RepID=A0A3L8P0E4_9ACTN|nr:hypothetical protein [Nocardioides mangrovicus]RLV48906.1 hypothetical protein D9V37_09925 [Nocardioides mangrovicus]
MVLGLGAALLAALLYGVAAVAQAVAARRLPALEDGVGRVAGRAVRDPLLVGAVVADLVGALLHLVSIENAPLYVSQAGVAAALPITALTSAIWVRERLTARDWAAVAATFGGIAVLAVDAGSVGSTSRVTPLTVVLYVGLAVVLVTAAAAYRGQGRTAALVLSFLGGLGYSGTALGARLLGDAGGAVAWGVLAVLIAGCGITGYWLYSFAMQRISVAAASAPLILTETLVPTVVGIALLGDDVPAWWAVVLGLLLSLAGALYLGGFEGRLQHPPVEATT